MSMNADHFLTLNATRAFDTRLANRKLGRLAVPESEAFAIGDASPQSRAAYFKRPYRKRATNRFTRKPKLIPAARSR